MSIVDREHAGPEAELAGHLAENPFYLGYRYPPRELPDGTLAYDAGPIPLTLEDLLFPEESDHAMHTREHQEATHRLFACLKIATAGRPRARVLADHRVDFDIPGVRPLGPDLAVFLDTPDDWPGATLRVGETGARPLVLIEVTSPETRDLDFHPKREFYHRAGVPCYVIVDLRYRAGIYRGAELFGFRHAPGGYETVPLDDRGRLPIEPLGCWLAIRDGLVACLDAEGEVMKVDLELHEAYQAEAVRADAEAVRADAEAVRADAEAAAREAAEAQVAALMEEIRRLRGGA